jgi:hypothetical protein
VNDKYSNGRPKKPPTDFAVRYKQLLEKERKDNSLEAKYNRIKAKYTVDRELRKRDPKAAEKKASEKPKQNKSIAKRYIMVNDKVARILESYKNGGRVPDLVPDEILMLRVGDLATVQATEKEIAACLGVNEDTWMTFKRKYPEVQELIDNCREEGKASLRKTQFDMAKTNPQVLIHALKYHLGQNEKVTGELQVNHNMLKTLMELPDSNDEVFETVKDDNNKYSVVTREVKDNPDEL